MARAKQILCVHPEPPELHIEALLNRHGTPANLTEAATPEALHEALAKPAWWDLILCDVASYFDFGIDDLLAAIKDELDASLILVRGNGIELTPSAAYRYGAAEVVARGDIDHLLMACKRELSNAKLRKEVRELRQAIGTSATEPGPALMLATIHSMGQIPSGEMQRPSDHGVTPEDRIKGLIDAGGLTLEFQPIISFQADEEHRGLFEVLIRLKDAAGQLLKPQEFLPIAEQAGWMGKIDLWIFRRALATLEKMQQKGFRDATLFINLATQTIQTRPLAQAIATFASAARISPGSLVIEVRKSAFEDDFDRLLELIKGLRSKHHGLLVEDIQLDDCAFLKQYSDLITHIKLDRAITTALVEGHAHPKALAGLVQCARREGIRVIALAVESADLLSMLFSAGIDAIQGHFVSLPHSELVYPSIQQIEAPSVPAWQFSEAKQKGNTD